MAPPAGRSSRRVNQGVLGRDANVLHPPSDRRGLIDGASPANSKQPSVTRTEDAVIQTAATA
jgi:hypothetical protein